MKKANIIISGFIYLVWLLLIGVGIWDLFHSPYRSIIWFFSFLLLIFTYSKFKKVPNYAHLLLSLIALLNIFGEVIFEFYYRYVHYDKLLHLVDPIFACIFIYHLTKPKIRNKKFLVMFCVFAAISITVGWEIIEYGFDNVFGSVMQGVHIKSEINHFFKFSGEQKLNKLQDTMWDMICVVLGTLVFALGSYLYWHSKNLKSRVYSK